MSAATMPAEAIWHDVECGDYAADLALWQGLAHESAGPTLDLGAGTGRVSLHLAAGGAEVEAVDRSPVLLEELRRRAAARGLEVATTCADVRELELGRRFAAILAPMQFVHLLGGVGGREALLRAVAAHLEPGGTFAAALLSPEGSGAAGDLGAPLPDVRELDGWIYSSQPLEVRESEGGIEVRRLRQRVSPAGELSEQVDVVRLDELAPQELEREAAAAGLHARERIEVAATADHVGSVVCVLEAGR